MATYSKFREFYHFFFLYVNIHELTSVFPDGGIIFSSTALYQYGMTRKGKTGFSSEIIAKLLIFIEFRNLLAICTCFHRCFYPILNYYTIPQPFPFLLYSSIGNSSLRAWIILTSLYDCFLIRVSNWYVKNIHGLRLLMKNH